MQDNFVLHLQQEIGWIACQQNLREIQIS